MIRKSLSNLGFSVGLAGSMLLAAAGVNADPSEWSKADYVNYCASCHGVDGTGNGPLADHLKGEPSDLTVLAKNNGGTFPYQTVYRTIDGTWDKGNLRAHGSDEMPVWGDVFRRKAVGQNSYMQAQARIMNVIQYIDSLQKQ